ncbi:hypothetical protein [Vibrio sp. 99-8-1]|uniref:hypothetical protein n=1 Tax=Vibrio sp. 99-8-1 TaxID=2607602 RepID=UPI001493A9C6|nr:hypothetical protein [Vibrio sp. 99-8-1]NOI65192.1 hypothetical protein [Vibrio sp. 99-8-1]
MDIVEDELERATQELKLVDVQTRKVVEKTIENVFMLLLAKTKGNHALARKFTDKLSSSIAMEVPTLREPLLQNALSIDETELSL